jgi:hypothetical protein
MDAMQSGVPLATAAVWYARHQSWPVFPLHGIVDGRCTCGNPDCKNPGKHPWCEHGVKDASIETAVIQSWWQRHPEANIGLATGEPSGVDVLDVDPRHQGDETLGSLERKHSELPPTVLSLTGGGGSHIFFQHTSGLKNLNGAIGEGLDIKTTGGYVVLPPSRHESGRAYTWEGASHPAEVAIASPPHWFIDLASGATGLVGGEGGSKAIEDRIPEGKRNEILASLAGTMRRRGMTAAEIEQALSAVNQRRCDPPLHESEVSRIAASVSRYQPAAQGTSTGEPKIRSIDAIPPIRECGAKEIRYLLEPELPEGAVVALTGDAGCGKSTLVTAWAGRVATSDRPVLILDRENPAAILIDRLERLHVTDGTRLRIWGGWLPEQAPEPASAIVLGWVAACDPKPLIVIDSLVAFLDGDENSSTEMRAFTHQCRRLADAGATAVILHHTGKSETAQDFRGSSDFKAAIDAGFHVSNFGDGGRLGKIVLRAFKSRYGFAGELTYEYADGLFVRGDVEDAREITAEQLTAILRLNPGITATRFEELASARNLGRNRARTWLSGGLLSKAIRIETGANNKKRYFLAGCEPQPDLS